MTVSLQGACSGRAPKRIQPVTLLQNLPLVCLVADHEWKIRKDFVFSDTQQVMHKGNPARQGNRFLEPDSACSSANQSII
jgi:hypothetical protein